MMGKSKKTKKDSIGNKNAPMSKYQKWCSEHTEVQLLLNNLWLWLSLLVALIFMAYELTLFTEVYSSFFAGILHNALVILGYSVSLIGLWQLIYRRLYQKPTFRRAALICLGSTLLLSCYAILGASLWLVDYLGSGEKVGKMVIWLLVSLALSLVLKSVVAAYRKRLTDKMINYLNYSAVAIKGAIFLVAFISCHGWVVLAEQEVILIFPLSVLGIGLAMFAMDAIVATSYLIYTDSEYAERSYQLVIMKRNKREREKKQTKKTEEKQAKKENQIWKKRLSKLAIKGGIALHILFILGGTILLYVANIGEALTDNSSLSISDVMRFRSEKSIEELAFLNPVHALPAFSSSVVLTERKALPVKSTNFYVMDELDWLTSEQENLVMTINRQFLQTPEKPQVVLALIDESSVNFDHYVAETFKSWQIGQKEYDNGILILFARNGGKHNVRIEVGYGLEELVTDSLAGQLLRSQQINLKDQHKEQVTAGLLAIFQELTSIIQLENDTESLSDLPMSHPLVKTSVLTTVPSIVTVFLTVLKVILLVDFGFFMLISFIGAIFSRGDSDGSGGSSSSGGGSWSSSGGSDYSGGGGSSGGGGASI